MCITVKVNVYRLGKNGGSGRVRVLGPDPTRPARVWTRADPTRRYCKYSGPDPTQPDPTRSDPRVDPTREQLCMLLLAILRSGGRRVVQLGRVIDTIYSINCCCCYHAIACNTEQLWTVRGATGASGRCARLRAATRDRRSACATATSRSRRTAGCRARDSPSTRSPAQRPNAVSITASSVCTFLLEVWRDSPSTNSLAPRPNAVRNLFEKTLLRCYPCLAGRQLRSVCGNATLTCSRSIVHHLVCYRPISLSQGRN